LERTTSTAGNASGGWKLASILLLLASIAFAYLPSLQHPPRADQWTYLTETIEEDHFAGLVAHTWSYSRTRMINPGDTHLYRPLLFVALAAEKSLFGHHFVCWQATGIVLHSLICVMLFLILVRLRALAVDADAGRSLIDLLPLILTLFFATNFVIIEQVVWSHISGYLIFTLLILTSLRLLLEWIADPEPSRRRTIVLLGSAWLLIALATFTYELGQFCALGTALFLAAAYLQKHRPRQAVLLLVLFLLIPVFYQWANHIDRRLHRVACYDDKTYKLAMRQLWTATCPENLGRYLSYVVGQPFLPFHCRCDLTLMGKLWIDEPLWLGQVAWDLESIGGMVVLGLGGLLLLLGTTVVVRQPARRSLMLLGLGIAACHIALIVCGRLNVRPGSQTLTLNSYYTYISLLFLLIGCSVPLLEVDRLRRGWPIVRGAVAVLALGLLVLSLANLHVTRDVNARGAQKFEPFRAAVAAVNGCIREHEKEPDFRLAVVRGSRHSLPLVSAFLVLHHGYLNADRPTHLVVERNGSITVTPIASWSAEHPGTEPDCYPDLICVRPRFFVLRKGNFYFGVPFDQLEAFLSAAHISDFTLSRRSLSELVALLNHAP
jgi:hypothetical protein